MVDDLKLSLLEMARLALGTPQLSNVNISVLHSLIDIILKKLDCANEKVTLSGYETQFFEKLLRETRTSPLAFDDEGTESISRKVENLDGLQERIRSIDKKLERHFEDIRRNAALQEDNSQPEKNWERFSKACEDLCTVYDPENEVACLLMRKPEFVNKLISLIGTPMVKRLVELEAKIENLNNELLEFIKRADTQYVKIALIEECINDIEEIAIANETYKTRFYSTMEELQDMLDAKMDKVHVPALKRYVKLRFEEVRKSTDVLLKNAACPRAIGFILESGQCSSCGKMGDVGKKAISGSRTYLGKENKFCGCNLDCYHHEKESPSLSTRMANLDLAQIKSLVASKGQGKKSCKVSDAFATFEGTDGRTYVKG